MWTDFFYKFLDVLDWLILFWLFGFIYAIAAGLIYCFKNGFIWIDWPTFWIYGLLEALICDSGIIYSLVDNVLINFEWTYNFSSTWVTLFSSSYPSWLLLWLRPFS